MRLYLSGPLFSEAERAWLDALAGRLRADGFDCFVPHEQLEEMTPRTADEVYRTDAEGLRSSNALVAWLDGAAVDDGTACEIGMFAQLVVGGDPAMSASSASRPTFAWCPGGASWRETASTSSS